MNSVDIVWYALLAISVAVAFLEYNNRKRAIGSGGKRWGAWTLLAIACCLVVLGLLYTLLILVGNAIGGNSNFSQGQLILGVIMLSWVLTAMLLARRLKENI